MRTTLDIDDDVLAVARRLAREHGRTLGAVVSDLARAGHARSSPALPFRGELRRRNGFPVPPACGVVVTSDLVTRLLDEDE